MVLDSTSLLSLPPIMAPEVKWWCNHYSLGQQCFAVSLVVVCNILIDSVSFMCGQLVYIKQNLGGIIGSLTLDSSVQYHCSEVSMPRMVCVMPNSASHKYSLFCTSAVMHSLQHKIYTIFFRGRSVVCNFATKSRMG